MALVPETGHGDDNGWLFAEGDDDPGEAPGNRGKLLLGLLLLAGLGVVAIGLVVLIAPSVNAVGGCGGG